MKHIDAEFSRATAESATVVDSDAELARITAALLHAREPTPSPNREVNVSHRRRAGLSMLLLLVALPMGCATAGRGTDISALSQLMCANPPTAVAEERNIGRWGGALRVGNHEVVIPARAVPNTRAFRLQPMAGPRVGVNFTGGNGNFAREVTVIISMEHCTAEELSIASSPNAFVIYRQTGNAWQRLNSTVDGRRVLAETRQNSGFIIVAE